MDDNLKLSYASTHGANYLQKQQQQQQQPAMPATTKISTTTSTFLLFKNKTNMYSPHTHSRVSSEN